MVQACDSVSHPFLSRVMPPPDVGSPGTLAHAPQARTAAIIGQGSGMSSHLLLGDPNLKELVTIEIEPR